jgi:SagB-type dehydrogenase family enzyme
MEAEMHMDTPAGRPAGIKLPEPRTTGGMPLMDALKQRHSTRKYCTSPISLQELSDVLWAASGLTREYAGSGIHTPGSHSAPAAHNWQEVDLYVALKDGLYRYDPLEHGLEGVLARDIRHFTAHEEQPFVLDAPVILIYVADLSRMHDSDERDRAIFPWADSAVMAENVYLYCSSAGLATVVRAKFERPPLAAAMGLSPEQLITFTQPLGYAG